MRIHFCGVRGSLPAVGREYATVGGNTSCVAISHDEDPTPSLVLDAGTGLRTLARLLDGSAFHGSLILGHCHWDHVIGLAFFSAGDRIDSRVRVLLPEQGTPAEELLERMMSPPLFPILPSNLRGDWTFETYDEGIFDLEGFQMMAREIPHKGGRTMGLRISDGRSSIAYLSDHAPRNIGPGVDGLGEIHQAALDLVDGVDVLIHDAQYADNELDDRADWGHSAANYAVTLGHECGVGRILLFHHDPSRTDDQVFGLRSSLHVPDGMVVDVAIEGAEIRL